MPTDPFKGSLITKISSMKSSPPNLVWCEQHSCDPGFFSLQNYSQTNCDCPLSVDSDSSVEDIRHRSNMSPNPENINFLDNVQQDDQEPDDRDDSGFFSGGPINSCRQDHETLITNEEQLRLCGFYHPELDSVSAMKMLKNSEVGTFLIRDSSDSRYLFALSVKTERGATSVRIMYQEGWFLFDCDERIRRRMPKFRSVLSLVNHHVDLSRRGINNSWRWEEKSGRKNMVVQISKPCRTSAPSLKHLCTIAVNNHEDRFSRQIFCNQSISDVVLNCKNDYPFRI